MFALYFNAINSVINMTTLQKNLHFKIQQSHVPTLFHKVVSQTDSIFFFKCDLQLAEKNSMKAVKVDITHFNLNLLIGPVNIKRREQG